MTQKNILITWDIDGTLIVGADAAVKIHQNAFKQACEEMFNKPCDVPDKFLQISLNGFMDQKILKMMITKLGSEPTQERMSHGVRRMEEIFTANCDVVPVIPPGVLEALEALYKMPNVTLGVASGNWPQIAWRKLKLAGLDRFFTRDNIAELGFFDDRKEALQKAREEGEKLRGFKFDTCIHVGDTVGDVKAAIEADFIAVAVRTGRCSYEYPQPSIVFNDLHEGRKEFFNLIQ